MTPEWYSWTGTTPVWFPVAYRIYISCLPIRILQLALQDGTMPKSELNLRPKELRCRLAILLA